MVLVVKCILVAGNITVINEVIQFDKKQPKLLFVTSTNCIMTLALW
jgi:hypothetical protein